MTQRSETTFRALHGVQAEGQAGLACFTDRETEGRPVGHEEGTRACNPEKYLKLKTAIPMSTMGRLGCNVKVHLKFTEAQRPGSELAPGAVGKPRPSRKPKPMVRGSSRGAELRGAQPGVGRAEVVYLKIQGAGVGTQQGGGRLAPPRSHHVRGQEGGSDSCHLHLLGPHPYL